jgi:hypothetical protein
MKKYHLNRKIYNNEINSCVVNIVFLQDCCKYCMTVIRLFHCLALLRAAC